MQTIKIKYSTTDEVKSLIFKYQRQYSSCLHVLYNRIVDNPDISEIELRSIAKSLHNIELIDPYLILCAVRESKQIYDTRSKLEFSLSKKQKQRLNKDQIEKKRRYFEEHRYKVIFGGKLNYFKRQRKRSDTRSSHEDWVNSKYNPLYVMGDKVNKGNRKFQINDDLTSITWKPTKAKHYTLNLIGLGNRLSIIKLLYLRLVTKDIAITYKIDLEYIYISFDEDILNDTKLNYGKVNNRVLGIDLNPNYIGWSIIDWKSESDFNIIKSGIYVIKNLNDKTKEFKGLKSNSSKRKWLNNKRNYETIQIVKNIINKAIHFNVLIISIEDLNIKSSDKEKGKDYNELCNNKWLRNVFVNNISKRCNILGIKLLKVKAAYSSFIGNFLYRSLNLPDMILSSIELSRRGYEFYNQYITKTKDIKKNIIRPNLTEFKLFYTKSLEEFDLEPRFKDLIELYEYFKNSKLRYRVPISNNIGFRFYSKKSLISVL